LQDAFCSGPFLRSLNAFLSTACYQLAYGVYGLTHSNPTQQQPAPGAWAAAAIASLPTHLFFAFLYYTDVAALLFLLLTQYLLLQHRPHWAAAAGAAAIGMRQTNAVWVTFLVGASMLRDLGVGAATGTASSSRSTSKAASAAAGTASGPRQKHGVKPGHRQQHNDSWRRTFAGGCFQELGAALQQLAVRWPQLLRDYCSCLLLPAAFAGFVVWNKGITLGDREAHAPVSHVMQPLYFAAFAVAAAGPLLLSPGVVAAVQRRAQQQPWVSTAAAVASAAMVCTYCVQQYSLAHPYLLADNRHYTFYLWKRLLRKQAVRQGLVPLYVIGWALLMEGLASTQGHLWAVAYAAATAITLAPAWLLEFR
jgi:alpha-1,2-glucosyltransferase